MFTVAICDDNKDSVCELSKMVDTILGNKKVERKILTFSSGDGLLEAIDKNDIKIDLLLLDIEMPGISGIEIKEALENNRKVSSMVFVTNHMEVIQEAFGAKVFGFLNKPIKFEELSNKIETMYKKYMNNTLIEVSKDVYVRKNNVSYIKASGNYCDFFCIDGRKIKAIRNTLSHFKSVLGENFIQIHRAILVNASEIRGNKHNQIVLSTGEELTISRSYRDDFKNQYFKVAINSIQERL